MISCWLSSGSQMNRFSQKSQRAWKPIGSKIDTSWSMNDEVFSRLNTLIPVALVPFFVWIFVHWSSTRRWTLESERGKRCLEQVALNTAINASFAGFHFVHSPCSFACKQFKSNISPFRNDFSLSPQVHFKANTSSGLHLSNKVMQLKLKQSNHSRENGNNHETTKPERITLFER